MSITSEEMIPHKTGFSKPQLFSGISIGSGEDITERMQYERKLRESEERYRTLFESTRDAIITTTPNGHKILSANAAAAEILGYEYIGDLLDRPVGDLYYDPEQRGIILSELMEKGYIEDSEVVFAKKDGMPVYLLASAIIRRDAEGNIVRLEGIFKDITERKQAEEELQNANLRLEDTLGELRSAQQQVIQQERMRALGELASGIAHDFNNSLMPILGYTELLLNVPNILEDKERLKERLELVNLAAEDARDIVSRLREFYRPLAEDEVFASTNLNQLVAEAIQLTQPRWKEQAQAAGIAINMEPNLQEIPHISCDKSGLREVLTNLILNAVDAMPGGGTIALHTWTDDSNVMLEVRDTGMGMTEDIRQRCFEPLFSTKGERGSGLGLSMVYGIIHRHNGTIAVESELGKGTAFVIRLPQIEAHEGVASHDTGMHVRSLHVLIVDDDILSCDIVAEYLKVDGHTFEIAEDGREGVTKFQDKEFDLVITDRSMPDINGVQLSTLIKQLAPKIPVMMLTGFGGMMESADEELASVDSIIGKPITLAKFRKAIADIGSSAGNRDEYEALN